MAASVFAPLSPPPLAAVAAAGAGSVLGGADICPRAKNKIGPSLDNSDERI
jgi:hypothetical protein